MTALQSETAKELLLFYEEDELFSVNFFPTKSRKAPGYSCVINAEQIEQSPARTLRDVLEMRVPGMTTGGHERHGPLIGTRGVFIDNNAKTLVMLDGQHINQRGHFGYTAGLLSPLLGDLKSAEVTLGPGAILHGSGAINGFINLIPKNGSDNPGFFASTEYGFTEELWKVESGYGASYGEGKDYYIYVGTYRAQGYEPDEMYGYTKAFNVRAKGFEDGNYRFSLYWNHDDFNLNTFYYENNPYKNGSLLIGHFHQAALGIRPKYIFPINNTDSLEIAGSLLWFDHSALQGPLPEDQRIDLRAGAESHRDVQTIYRTTRWEDHSLAAGLSYGEKSFYQDRQFFGDNANLWMGTINTQWEEVSLFGEDVIALSKSWTASFGLRYEKIHLNDMNAAIWGRHGTKKPDQIKGHYSPRIATAYNLNAETTIKASYQHGFRTPDAFYYMYFLTYRDEAKALGQSFPELDVETMDSFEINLHRDLPAYGIKVDCNLFYNIFEDQLRWRFYEDIGLLTEEQRSAIKESLGLPPRVRLGSFLNAPEEIKAYGGEINAGFRPLTNTEISLSYGYVHLRNADRMQYPKHQVKVNSLSRFLEDRLNLAFSLLYNNSYQESDLPDAHGIYRDDRYVVDVALHYNLTAQATIGLIANNLFENDVPPMVFEPDRLDKGGLGYASRRVYLQLTMKF